MKQIILITGGQRSGKSNKAEELALSLSENPVYLATAHVWDEEFRERVRRHQERRGPQWTNIEEETALSKHDMTGVERCDLYLRDQRDWQWRCQRQCHPAEVHGPAGLDEPVYCAESRRSDTNGQRNTFKSKRVKR